MSRGHADFGQSGQTTSIVPVTDLGELAVRLGSNSIYSRSGNVLYSDSFEYGAISWIPNSLGSYSIIEHITDFSYMGSGCIKLESDGSVTDEVSISKIIKPIQHGVVGFEVTFSLASNVGDFRMIIEHKTGSMLHSYYIEYSYSNDTLSNVNPTGEELVFDDIGLSLWSKYHFNTIKVIVNLIDNSLLGVHLNNQYYDFERLPAYSISFGSYESLTFRIEAGSLVSQINKIFIDNVIITINETL